MKNATTMEQLYAALFTRPVMIGDRNPPGEAVYDGYYRVPFIALDGTNLSDVHFPPARSDYPVRVTHVAALTESGVVRACQEL